MSKILETYIRSILNEQSAMPGALSNVGLVVDDNEQTLYFVDTRAADIEIAVVGKIRLEKKNGGCHEGYEIITSVSSVKGLGKYLYRMAGQYAIRNGNGLVMPNREILSIDAWHVWNYFYNNTSAEQRHEFDDIQDPKTPPKEDDCTINRDGEEILNYAYEIDVPGDSELYDALIDVGNEWAKSLEGARGKIGNAADKLFSDIYDARLEKDSDEMHRYFQS